jgi:hypothetical protein
VTARRRAGAAAEPRRLGPYTTRTPPEASDPRQRRVGDGLVSASAGHDRDHTSPRGPRQIDAAKPRTGSRPAAEYADQRGQSKETRGTRSLGISTGSAHKEAYLHSAQAPLKTQPQALLPRRNRTSRRPPDERYLRTRSPAQARPRPSHRRRTRRPRLSRTSAWPRSGSPARRVGAVRPPVRALGDATQRRPDARLDGEAGASRARDQRAAVLLKRESEGRVAVARGSRRVRNEWVLLLRRGGGLGLAAAGDAHSRERWRGERRLLQSRATEGVLPQLRTAWVSKRLCTC